MLALSSRTDKHHNHFDEDSANLVGPEASYAILFNRAYPL